MPKERTLMVRMPEALHKAVRVKTADMGVPISEIVRDLLSGWVAGKIELPQPEATPAEKEGGKHKTK